MLVFSAYATLSIASYERFTAHSYDLGIFEQVIRQYAHLHAPIAHIKGVNTNALGDHFSPLLAILAPAYRVFPSAVTLQVEQAALFALSLVPITNLAMRHTSDARGLAIGAAYGLAWGLQQAVAVDFHEICLAVPLLALSLGAIVDRRWRACALLALPLVLVKEDLGLTVAMIGICLLIRGQRRLGAGLAAFGTVASTLTIVVVMPALNPTGRYTYWSGLTAGHTHSAIAVLENLLDPPATKLVTLAMIFGITGFLALRSPLSLVAIPTLLWRFLADVPSYWGTDWHYNAVLMPIIFVALVDAITSCRGSRRRWLRAYARGIAPAVIAAAISLSGQSPVGTLIDPATYRAGPSVAQARAALAHIPSHTTVETDPGLMAHLTKRCDVYFITRTGNPPPDYLVVATAWMPSISNAAAFAQQLHPQTSYKLVYSSAAYQVAQRQEASR
ncbi:MAG: DUF2079 domain-containing protein [Sciscionella sp.]